MTPTASRTRKDPNDAAKINLASRFEVSMASRAIIVCEVYSSGVKRPPFYVRKSQTVLADLIDEIMDIEGGCGKAAGK